jgi:D-alanyl-D-alanine carboxypeptidase/D-alanyl-D-alanine-endopeptidase (penicillin-binding protein 4)
VILSPPLRDIMPAFEKPSQNQIGEILLRTVGLERTGAGIPDSGRAVIERQLLAWGATRDGFIVRDGSGLSRYNYLSPETLVRVLDVMRQDTAFQVFYDAVPIAGVDGTLANRLKGTYAEANARGKTGFVSQARSLSGYVTSADGRLLIYSLLCNNWTGPVRTVERVQDSIVARLAGMTAGAR